jgi:hypothetical protein
VARGLAEGSERFHHVLIVVEYRDVHMSRVYFAILLSKLARLPNLPQAAPHWRVARVMV